MRKIYGLAAFLSLVGMAALAGLAGYLAANGKLDAQRIDAIAAVLRGDAPAAASQPASQPASAPSSAPILRAERSADELKRARREEMFQRAAVEGALRDLAIQKSLLDKAAADLMTREDDFEQKKSSWKKEQEMLANGLRDEGFERELTFVGSLSAKQSKDHLMKTWLKSRADAVRIITALEPSKAKRILEQMKSPEELQIVHELLEQVRESNVDKLTPGPGKALSDASRKP
jgi:hypothetical protein